ncbi:hypothetical protein JOF41_003588 [Saccharothrix coeruleofusca]|uniref:hypothetical protein n=1 Tax=Saccharothrix coeruleofusca TaxID=33919 RepID=UPI0027DD9138|nr:hypothetical protein [Saccharothrix coeruleofusca]MBP2337410.1 hypothetical protein [Saccharothrix coeruleofusca]
MLLRLAYLGVTNAVALLRLLPMSDRDKDTEILALRHQITIPEREPGKSRPRSSPTTGHSSRHCCTDFRPPRFVDSNYWYTRRQSCGAAPGTREPRLGYRRVHGELLVLGIKVAASTVWQILKDAGIDPAPSAPRRPGAAFLPSQADTRDS